MCDSDAVRAHANDVTERAFAIFSLQAQMQERAHLHDHMQSASSLKLMRKSKWRRLRHFVRVGEDLQNLSLFRQTSNELLHEVASIEGISFIALASSAAATDAFDSRISSAKLQPHAERLKRKE